MDTFCKFQNRICPFNATLPFNMTPWHVKLPVQKRDALVVDQKSLRVFLQSSFEHVRASLVQRSPVSTSASAATASSTCQPGSKSQYCQYGESSSDMTLPIALGIWYVFLASTDWVYLLTPDTASHYSSRLYYASPCTDGTRGGRGWKMPMTNIDHSTLA